MKVNTYLIFPGTSVEAFCYYEKHLGAKSGMMMTQGQLPDQDRFGINCMILHERPMPAHA
ncbi:MAG TPA: hypothetical protein VJN89_17925 [Candidatus Acidoferrum sp.]|nr:hypothetical protein [Candidatus Acidoferrum sp.]